MKIFISVSRNVSNIDSWERFASKFATEQEPIRLWVSRQLRKWARDDGPAVRVEHAPPGSPEWMTKAVEAGELYSIDYDQVEQMFLPVFDHASKEQISFIKKALAEPTYKALRAFYDAS